MEEEGPRGADGRDGAERQLGRRPRAGGAPEEPQRPGGGPAARRRPRPQPRRRGRRRPRPALRQVSRCLL